MDFDKLLTTGVSRGASDLHLKPDAAPVLRIHGRLVPQPDLGAISPEWMEYVARRVLPEKLYAQLKEGREVDVAYTVPAYGRFRVNFFLASRVIRAVLRAIPADKASFEALGLPPVLEKLVMERRGLVLVTGISGAGKSTTLAAMIDYINRKRNDHIVTIEDPIEFTHDDQNCVITQREIGTDSPDFATALRAALREDPDVILVGEMRDAETMGVALHAAETGHLVFSTLHTLNAMETVNRMIGMFPAHQEQQIRDQLAAVLQGIVSQRLVPRVGGESRVPAVEVMVGSALIRECIRESKRTPEITQVIAAGQAAYGMQTFDQSVLTLYRDGIIAYETALETATSPDDFARRVRGIFSSSEMGFDQGDKKQEERPAEVLRTPATRPFSRT
ncbi:MAG: type IV pilus twitching motility protein PilT [Candidatus Rokubacteria bacterium]|nr:type IV pilus twitching motility protein PilT [Candidatus Rokubacteria bacterium]MBI3827574.1 type IV pilus twitching motility protein PilT [Candidatus Rokubacteria bacterium]